MSKHCKYWRRATPNVEAMTPLMAATHTGIKRKKITKHRNGKCACAKPTEQGTK
jgi:hypothetical protein